MASARFHSKASAMMIRSYGCVSRHGTLAPVSCSCLAVLATLGDEARGALKASHEEEGLGRALRPIRFKNV